jgi:hypothetical protein
VRRPSRLASEAREAMKAEAQAVREGKAAYLKVGQGRVIVKGKRLRCKMCKCVGAAIRSMRSYSDRGLAASSPRVSTLSSMSPVRASKPLRPGDATWLSTGKRSLERRKPTLAVLRSALPEPPLPPSRPRRRHPTRSPFSQSKPSASRPSPSPRQTVQSKMTRRRRMSSQPPASPLPCPPRPTCRRPPRGHSPTAYPPTSPASVLPSRLPSDLPRRKPRSPRRLRRPRFPPPLPRVLPGCRRACRRPSSSTPKPAPRTSSSR